MIEKICILCENIEFKMSILNERFRDHVERVLVMWYARQDDDELKEHMLQVL